MKEGKMKYTVIALVFALSACSTTKKSPEAQEAKAQRGTFLERLQCSNKCKPKRIKTVVPCVCWEQ